MSHKIYRKCIKRMLDIFISVFGLIITSPVLLITAIMIKLDSKGDILFRQVRLGRGGREFTIYKFRSMCMNAEQTGTGQYSYKGDPRVTRVGRIIRATSIDELPQFINILKGDMSLVGFRPPLTYHPWPIEDYTPQQMKMFAERPGITGWAQVNGRKELPWEDRIALSIWYAENISFALDVKIVFKTIGKVFTNADNANTQETV